MMTKMVSFQLFHYVVFPYVNVFRWTKRIVKFYFKNRLFAHSLSVVVDSSENAFERKNVFKTIATKLNFLNGIFLIGFNVDVDDVGKRRKNIAFHNLGP